MAEEKPANNKSAALLIAHGSRLDAANQDLVALAEQLGSRRIYPIVEIAYLELARADDFGRGQDLCPKRALRVSICFPTSSLPVRMSATTSRTIAAN